LEEGVLEDKFQKSVGGNILERRVRGNNWERSDGV